MTTILQPGTIEDVGTDQGAGLSFCAQIQVTDDAAFPLEVVIASFCQRLPGYDIAKAYAKCEEIEQHGTAVVWGGPREICELYTEQLNGDGLDARVLDA